MGREACVVTEEGGRNWTLDAAREIIADVRKRTQRAVQESDELVAERDVMPPKAPERAKADERIQAVVSRWAREMEALGLEVKGLWLVDFDNGSGYYCWQWPESDLAHYHGYDEGFDARVRIQ
jgi:hypothetical protein